jgi:hypothetical protein
MVSLTERNIGFAKDVAVYVAIVVDSKEKNQKRSIRSLNIQDLPLADVSVCMEITILRDREHSNKRS